MGSIRLYGSTSGYLELQAPAVAPDSVLTLPSDSLQPGLVHLHTETFSAVSSVDISSCFTSTYDNYTIVYDLEGSTNADLTMQLRNAGSNITAANYQWVTTGYDNGGNSRDGYATGQTSWGIGRVTSASLGTIGTVNIYNPLDSRNPHHTLLTFYYNSNFGTTILRTYGLRYGADQAHDGFSLAASTGTMTGSIRIYGYRNN